MERIGIIGAMDEEIALLSENMTEKRRNGCRLFVHHRKIAI
ncbi:hypothetical protein P5G51_008915 [Virgibacillus sp. 179-BFC.A HS]|uniref:5'-methylthioadenosine/S-adenosylhomocysteine nucleosidase n=1 Tax=Tigheibacillus jepli TaxID=3035914 RepID=A0ABU5CIZ7_9BACI|nr:hypothetical protein [Virgibacillus sp. 179-BFC.A HS]MDY0405503.1 hypothetical protein [Virgibacillus sp. 179-BFC.A HS]